MYALRRTFPEWRFDELLEEAVELAPAFGVDEIIVKIDTEEFSHGHVSPEWARSYQRKLIRLRDRLSDIGIRYSLNPWLTLGHADRGRDDTRRMAGLQTMVGHDGTTARHCACPLSQVWQDNLREIWTIYAETHPHVIWVEDDIRTFNHAPVLYGCFCPEHLKRFSERVGRSVTREELSEAIFRSGVPHPWRAEYLAMQCEAMTELAGRIGAWVHAVSPETCMGLMSSGPRNHCIEGRDWEAFATALADGRPLYSRPPFGIYNEFSLQDEYHSQDSIKLTRFVMPKGAIDYSEIENYPYTRFSKSVSVTFLEMAISFIYGTKGVTLNLFDHLGTPMKENIEFGKMMAKEKPFLAAIKNAVEPAGEYRGVRILHNSGASETKRLTAKATPFDLVEEGYELIDALERNGIPTTYSNEHVIATSGQILRSFSDAEIAGLLKRSVFMDGEAASVLMERGFGDMIGIKGISEAKARAELPWVVSAEEYWNAEFGGEARRYLSCNLPSLEAKGRFHILQPTDDAQIVSSLVNPDTERIATAMTAFQNKSGGRIVVHALNYASCLGAAFYSPLRREQMQNVVKWLSNGQPSILFKADGSYGLAWRKQAGGAEIVGCFNLTHDEWSISHFEMAWGTTMPHVFILNDDGIWSKTTKVALSLENGVLAIQYHGEISYRRPLILKLQK